MSACKRVRISDLAASLAWIVPGRGYSGRTGNYAVDANIEIEASLANQPIGRSALRVYWRRALGPGGSTSLHSSVFPTPSTGICLACAVESEECNSSR